MSRIPPEILANIFLFYQRQANFDIPAGPARPTLEIAVLRWVPGVAYDF